MHWKPWLIILVMMSATLSGCLSDDSDNDNGSSSYSSYPEPWDRAKLIYDDSDVFSRVIGQWHIQYLSTPIGLCSSANNYRC